MALPSGTWVYYDCLIVERPHQEDRWDLQHRPSSRRKNNGLVLDSFQINIALVRSPGGLRGSARIRDSAVGTVPKVAAGGSVPVCASAVHQSKSAHVPTDGRGVVSLPRNLPTGRRGPYSTLQPRRRWTLGAERTVNRISPVLPKAKGPGTTSERYG